MRNEVKAMELPEATKYAYKQALRRWVDSLPRAQAEATSVLISGDEFSPKQILHEIENETDLGKELLASLYALSLRLKAANKTASIVDLIRRSR
jgi:hypothetical protein